MYQKLYNILFNAITDAVEELDKSNGWAAREILISAQRRAEEAYLQAGEDEEPQE